MRGTGRHRSHRIRRAFRDATVSLLLAAMAVVNLAAGITAGCTSTGGVKHTPPTVEIHQ